MRSVVFAAFALGVIFLTGCSHNKGTDPPYTPPEPREGRVSIFNNSGVPITIAGYSQTRGGQREQIQLWVHLFAGQRFALHNLIDPGQSQLFPGGDRLSIVYYADAPDPSNPTEPLFDGTVELMVDGSLIIQVKSGGEYGISPG